MEALRQESLAAPRRRDVKEHNWRQELPLPARLAMGTACITLLGALLLTGVAWQSARRDLAREAQASFAGRVADIQEAVRTRMQAQEQVLRGGRGLFAASGHVTRQEWHAYVASLELEKTYPGIQGIGFAKRLAPEKLDRHVREVRRDGIPDYALQPAGKREDYTAIVYLEPFDWRNRRALGFDMTSEPVRRQAMEAARDTGRPTVSGKVTLVQETGRDIQAGFLMYLPVYRNGATVASLAERRAALVGYVYSPFRMNDLMAGILGSTLPDVALRIYDGPAATPAALMYDSQLPAASAGEAGPSPGAAAFVDAQVIEVGGRSWTLEVTSLPVFEARQASQKPRLILEAGIVVSLLLAIVVWSLATLRRRATRLARDMTAALRESREQFRAVAETANDAIISADSQGRITFFNRTAERLFGYSREEALGQPLTLLMPARLQPMHQAAFERRLARGEGNADGRAMAVTGRRRDGSEFPIELSVASWSTADGTFFTAILRDISQRIAAEAQIRELNGELQRQVAQLAEANRDLESFSYSVSHDLRAPLRAIRGFAGMLEQDQGAALPAEGRQLLGNIQESSQKMALLIDDLLAFARLGAKPINRRQVDMAHLVAEIIAQIRQDDGTAQVAFQVGDLPPAPGDLALLRQVWTNLIGNAVKFSRPQAAPQVEVGGCCIGDEWQYHVRDNGVGFDMAYAAKLFGVFQRLHRRSDFPGTGVGLAIVQRIVTKHGGRVWAEAEVGKGATFHFSLPAAEADSESVAAGAGSGPP